MTFCNCIPEFVIHDTVMVLLSNAFAWSFSGTKRLWNGTTSTALVKYHYDKCRCI